MSALDHGHAGRRREGDLRRSAGPEAPREGVLELIPTPHGDAERPVAGCAWRPRVSVVLPIRNESGHIGACLERLLDQDYPLELMEILVIDGCSQDGTQEVVQRVRDAHPDANMRLLINPERVVPPALNIGIRAATSPVVIRMDGHARPAKDYVSKCVAALARSSAANVGGIVEPESSSTFGKAVALATRHRLGAGDARYRIGGEACDVDTVMYGAFRREVFKRVGLFDESLVRNQDYEINVRIRAAGERVHFDPHIRFKYTPRNTARALWTQYLQYGWWRVETLRRHPESLRWRQLIPPVFAASQLVMALAAPWSTFALAALMASITIYTVVVGFISWRIAEPPASPERVALAFAVIHFGFALGFLLNLFSGGRFPYRAEPPKVPTLDDATPAAEATT
jgi:succinoglycan biosynthesis protein ExoA